LIDCRESAGSDDQVREGDPSMTRFLLKLVVPVCIALAATPHGNAQAGWFDEGRKLLEGLSGSESASGALSNDEIAAGLKEALRVGTDRVVGQLGVIDGFNMDPSVHIPLPESLKTAQYTLGKVGMSALMDDLELRLNRAAEAATPKARKLFLDSIRDMTLEDVRRIYEGPDDAATRYFQARMSDPLADEMMPIVRDSLAKVGAIRAYDDAMGRYEAIPFVPDVKADLTRYVVDKGLEGIFHYLAREEAAIRRNPLERTTELLREVFGAR
jgi:hypothetical protein